MGCNSSLVWELKGKGNEKLLNLFEGKLLREMLYTILLFHYNHTLYIDAILLIHHKFLF
jgi:hypothetical protein